MLITTPRDITYSASITMYYATQQLLRSVYGSLLEIGEFDLIVSFANPMASDDRTTTTVTLKVCIFSEDCLESQQETIRTLPTSSTSILWISRSEAGILSNYHHTGFFAPVFLKENRCFSIYRTVSYSQRCQKQGFLK